MDEINPTRMHQAEDEASIRRLVQQMEASWNAGDGNAFAALFTEDAHFVNIMGWHVTGRKAITEGHEQIFATIYKDSQNTALSTAVRFVRADIALAYVDWHLRFWQEGVWSDRQAMSTLVLVKQTEPVAWQITSFHNTPIVAP